METEDGAGPVEPTSSAGSSGVDDERLKIDSNLVIVVGKDGTVHVDQKTLHSLLANETTDTSVSVVRIASPTPSIEDEIEQERRLAQEEKLQQELEAAGLVPDDAEAVGPEETAEADTAPATPSGVSTRRSKAATALAKKDDVLLEGGDPPHVSLMVEGFYPPEEAKKFAEEVLTMAGLRKPLTVETEPVDYEFQRYVVANDHCYTPLTSPSQKLPPRSYYEEHIEQPAEVVPEVAAPLPIEEGPTGRRRAAAASKASPIATAKSRPRKNSVSMREESSSNDAEDLQSILQGSDSDSNYSEESSYPEEDDNESDLDFDISGKSQSKKRKSGSKNSSGSKKKVDDHVETKKKPMVRSPTKKVEIKLVTPTSMVTKSAVPKTYGSKKPQEVPPTVVPPVQPVAPPALVVKKVKPVPKPHVEALFSDMSSLFSTPDIIKKVGQSKAPGTPTTQTPTPSSSRGFVYLSKGTSQKLPAQISIQTHTSASEENLIDVLAAQDPEPTPMTSTTPTPLAEDIVKMLENNLPPGGVQEPVLPITDNSILAALGSNDDGSLPEDLLQHVAELAENKELQEILDKQVLGVIADVPSMPAMSSTSTVIPIAHQQMMQPVIAPPQPVLQRSQPPTQTPAESLPTMTVKEQLMPRKESIQIRRSDGRVITLPPIEAPATRSKRRAQTTPSASPAVSASPSTPIQPPVNTPTTASLLTHTPQSSKTSSSTKASASKVSTPVGITSYDDGSGSLLIDETRGKAGGNRSASSSRRTSESSNNSGRSKRQSTAAVAAVVAAEAAEDEVESDESWNSEDDPDRLWCICRQPHNNRFMICCDVCEDWFHGKCVNITKAMGQQMEADGIEWTCPNCLKKKQEKQQPKMTDFLVSSSSSTSSIGAGSASAITMSPKTVASITSAAAAAPAAPVEQQQTTGCVVCGKVARANSVYCSDACIRKHAGISSMTAKAVEAAHPAKVAKEQAGGKQQQQTIADGIKKLDSSSAGKAVASVKSSGPIIVMERKTGRCLTGKNAPTAENLKAWLQSHPTFEVVPPGSPQAAIILAKQAEVRKLQQAKESQKKSATTAANPAANQTQTKSHAQSKHSDKKNTLFSPSIPVKVTTQQVQSTKSPTKTSSKTVISTPTTTTTTGKGSPVTTGTPKSAQGGLAAKTPSSSTSTSSSSSKSQKRPAATAAPDAKSATVAAAGKTTPPAPATVPGGENIRVTVKKTLKEHLLQRTSELDPTATRLTESEIDKFVAEVEEEMFAMFNKDTGTKYRAKYRTLVFNIKDRKNLSLFQKICEKRIEGKQLVRMTPEELASQQLAQWRENEVKHQLEMIKKSELDLLACTKNYVLKTHKGEEVIEGKIDDRVQLDPTTAVEDVVAVLNNSTVSSTSELDSSSAKDRSKDFDLSFGKYSTGLYGSGSITSSTLASTATSSNTSASKKKDSRRSRSRSRSRERRRDRSRDRSRSRHKRRRSRSRSRHGSRDRDRARSRHRDHRKQDSKECREKDQKLDEKATTSVDRNEAVGKPVEAKKAKKAEGKPVPESGNLIDQILASAGAVSKPSEATTEKETPPVAVPEEPPKRTVSPISATTSPLDQQDQEPTSTVTIPTPPHSTDFDSESPSTDFGTPEEDTRKEALKIHWTGNVHMVDVASVEMSIRSVSGNIDDVAKDFSEDLDICGTIKPEIVWDYIGQIKKSANKEIYLVRFHSNERAAYYTLYTHLFSRKRYSVIKSPSKAIKDFYVFPLPSEQMIPMILKPLTGVGIIEGDKKPDLLLGIIVKVWGKRSSTASSSSSSMPPAKTSRRSGKAGSSAAVSPSFALMQQVITKYATVNKKSNLDATSTPPGSPGPVPPPPSTAAVKPPPPLPPAPMAPSVAPPPPPPVIQIRSRSASDSPEHVDIDMDIIKRPALKSGSSTAVVTVPETSLPPVVIDDDDDEPYSPGGGSDDSDQFADVTAIVETKGRRSGAAVDPEAERIRLEMEEINRKIAEEKNEIVGILSSAELKADEIKSTLTPSLITDISIPSNLSEILASINKTIAPTEPPKSTTAKPADDEEEYVPTAPSLYSGYKSGYSYGKSAAASIPVLVSNTAEPSTSKLSKLSDAQLLSMVPDDSYLQPATASKTSKITEDDVVELDSDDSVPPPPQKKSKWVDDGTSEPPPPGLEDPIDLE